MLRMKSSRRFSMGRLFLLCCVAIVAGTDLPAQLPSTLNLPDGPVATGDYWYGATSSITAGTSLTIDGSASVTALAGAAIYLTPGFTAIAGSATSVFTAMVGTPPVLSIGSVSLPSGTVGSGYTFTLSASGGSGTYVWIRSSDRDCARSPSHTTGRAVFRIRRLNPAVFTSRQGSMERESRSDAGRCCSAPAVTPAGRLLSRRRDDSSPRPELCP